MTTTNFGRRSQRPRGTVPGFTGQLRRHLLLVDPDPIFTKLLLAWLERRGWRVNAFASGRKALAAAAGLESTVALINLESSDIDGFEVTELLRRIVPGLPIVACAPHAAVATWDPATLESLGLDKAIARPVRFPILENALRHASDRGSGTAADPESVTFRLDGT